MISTPRSDALSNPVSCGQERQTASPTVEPAPSDATSSSWHGSAKPCPSAVGPQLLGSAGPADTTADGHFTEGGSALRHPASPLVRLLSAVEEWSVGLSNRTFDRPCGASDGQGVGPEDLHLLIVFMGASAEHLQYSYAYPERKNTREGRTGTTCRVSPSRKVRSCPRTGAARVQWVVSRCRSVRFESVPSAW